MEEPQAGSCTHSFQRAHRRPCHHIWQDVGESLGLLLSCCCRSKGHACTSLQGACCESEADCQSVEAGVKEGPASHGCQLGVYTSPLCCIVAEQHSAISIGHS